ncbi:MAG: hypothetical protein ABEJ42_08660, partial [Halobacteriaceae archaeon]
MTDALAALLDAFERTDRRLATFDRGLRERTGRWWLADPVPAAAVCEALLDTATVRGDAVGQVPVPLHEPDGPELTGEYLAYRPGEGVVVYRDPGAGGPATVPVDEVGDTVLAWRLRFWHPAYEPPTTPSFLADAGDRGFLARLRAALGSGGGSERDAPARPDTPTATDPSVATGRGTSTGRRPSTADPDGGAGDGAVAAAGGGPPASAGTAPEA